LRNSNIVVLSDFDETITSVNVLNLLYKKFASPSYKSIIERWEKGEISTKVEIEECFATIQANRTEMEAYLSGVTIDQGFPDLFHQCNERNIPLAIVSDGLSWYIDYILHNNDIEGVPVYANEIFFEPNGFRFNFPWFNIQSPLRGISKKTIVREYQRLGFFVVFIGDGLSDTGAAGVADILFSKGKLSKYAKQNDIEAREYSGLSDVLNQMLEIT
jgi:2,3-diketo-5-methylthio-1-phosphopentane phosphatase